jgi:hypothetical protein
MDGTSLILEAASEYHIYFFGDLVFLLFLFSLSRFSASCAWPSKPPKSESPVRP